MGKSVRGDNRAEGMSVIPIDDHAQYFERESTFRRRGFLDEIQRRFISFDEYIDLLFSPVPGEYIIRGL